jgi:hypothetical protein
MYHRLGDEDETWQTKTSTPVHLFKNTSRLLRRFPHIMLQLDPIESDRNLAHKAVAWKRHSDEPPIAVLPLLQLLVHLQPGITLQTGKDHTETRLTPYKILGDRLGLTGHTDSSELQLSSNDSQESTKFDAKHQNSSERRSKFDASDFSELSASQARRKALAVGRNESELNKILLSNLSETERRDQIIDLIVTSHRNGRRWWYEETNNTQTANSSDENAIQILYEDWLPFIMRSERATEGNQTKAFEVRRTG